MLTGKILMITGAASGIGLAAARLAAGYGATLALVDRDSARLAQAAAELPDALPLAVDVCDADAVHRAVAATEARFGRLDAAFDNAGVEQLDAGMYAIDAYPMDDFDRVLAVNLKAQMLLLQAQLPALRRAGGGAILFTASVMGLYGQPGMAAYVASKHGVAGLTRVAALEGAAHGIRVNAIAPGAVRTPMLTERAFPNNPGYEEAVAATHPMGRLAAPEEIAEAALWLLSDRASFVTGAVVPVDGGYSAR
jgi:NAD(P)-dependent dehydrogenase (short-subunit alcohol dehydrogenase family)